MAIYNPNKTQRQCSVCRKKIEYDPSPMCRQCFMDLKQPISLEKRLCDVEWWIENYQTPMPGPMVIGGI